MIASTPKPPYLLVAFSSQRSEGDHEYAATAARMVELAALQPGFLGIESARDTNGFGITLSFWRSEADILAWRDQLEHRAARERGRRDWYERMITRVARVERDYGFCRPQLCIRPALPADQGYCWQQEQLNIAPMLAKIGLGRDFDAFAASWAQTQNHLLQLDGQTIGLMRWREREGRLHLTDLQIEARFRRQGHGRRAMQQFAQTALALGYSATSLLVFSGNHEARRFYQRLAYTEIERSEPNILLQLRLSANSPTASQETCHDAML